MVARDPVTGVDEHGLDCAKLDYNPRRPEPSWSAAGRGASDLEAATKRIAAYRPRGLAPDDPAWLAVGPAVRRWAASVAPKNDRRAYDAVITCSRFALWLHRTGAPVEDATALAVPVIDRFVHAGCEGMTGASKRNYRSLLTAVAEASPDAPVPPARFTGQANNKLRDPYTSAEQAAIWAWASSQPRTYHHDARVLASLSFGAGLHGADFRFLRGTHVTRTPGGAVAVEVTGSRPRTTAVLAEWEDATLSLALASGDAYLFRAHSTGRVAHNLANGFLSRTRDHGGTVPFYTARARTTWIVRHLAAGTPPGVLIRAAGLKVAPNLNPYLRFVPEHDLGPDRVLAALRRPGSPS